MGIEETGSSHSAPRIWIEPLGNTGNRALQYLVAQHIREFVPNAQIENIYLPEWGIDSRTPKPSLESLSRLGWNRFWMDVRGFADCLERGVIKTLILDNFCYNIDHYPSRTDARKLLGETITIERPRGFGAGELVCNVRGAEVLENAHPDYIPLPAGYYKSLQQQCGLDLVFYGQLGNDPYTESLRKAFPNAAFIQGRNPEYDFDMIRNSENIAISISTFSWLAAWLSNAKRIFVPVGGIFSPVQNPLQNFLPLDDQVYQYVLLPYSKAVSLSSDNTIFFEQQKLISESLRFLERRDLVDICRRAERFAIREPYVGGFDPQYYVKRYGDVAEQIRIGHAPSALEQYLADGHRQNRQPLEFDPISYVKKHPDAALAIAEGFYVTPIQHYMAVGYYKGYKPL